jgi:hypothetical protein
MKFFVHDRCVLEVLSVSGYSGRSHDSRGAMEFYAVSSEFLLEISLAQRIFNNAVPGDIWIIDINFAKNTLVMGLWLWPELTLGIFPAL